MHRERVLESREYLSRVAVWRPIPSEIRPEQWLRNFPSTEQEHALALLDSFLFYNSTLTDRLFTTAIRSLSEEITRSEHNYAAKKTAWASFLDQVFITHPTDEYPNVTDSGHIFDRRTRQLLHIDQSQIGGPEQALQVLYRQPHRPLLFVDDFAGSGNQFIETWDRSHELSDRTVTSLAGLAAAQGMSAYYCPAMATDYSRQALLDAGIPVLLRPAHWLSAQYSATHPSSLLFPAHLLPTATDFIETSSARAGINAGMTFGYKGLALAIAFEHSVPDATLPIFWADVPGWTPLLRRR